MRRFSMLIALMCVLACKASRQPASDVNQLTVTYVTTGVVTGVSHVWSGNGDGSIEVRSDAGVDYVVSIVGTAPSSGNPTVVKLKTAKYLLYMTGKRVQVSGPITGKEILATHFEELDDELGSKRDIVVEAVKGMDYNQQPFAAVRIVSLGGMLSAQENLKVGSILVSAKPDGKGRWIKLDSVAAWQRVVAQSTRTIRVNTFSEDVGYSSLDIPVQSSNPTDDRPSYDDLKRNFDDAVGLSDSDAKAAFAPGMYNLYCVENGAREGKWMVGATFNRDLMRQANANIAAQGRASWPGWWARGDIPEYGFMLEETGSDPADEVKHNPELIAASPGSRLVDGLFVPGAVTLHKYIKDDHRLYLVKFIRGDNKLLPVVQVAQLKTTGIVVNIPMAYCK